MVGVNPEVAHETMAGLNFVHAVALALWAGKLFHIDLNAQRMSRYDQDFRFGQEDLKEAFLLVRLLEDSGYDGPRHFDAHALRVEDSAGVEEFARGCMRTYLILAEKARELDADPRFAEALAAAQAPALGVPTGRPLLGAGCACALRGGVRRRRTGTARRRPRARRPAARRASARGGVSACGTTAAPASARSGGRT